MIRLRTPVRVLLVDHNEEEVTDIKFALDKLEIYYEFSWAKNAKEALGILSDKTKRRQLPDLILIDSELPGTDSETFVKAIREQAEGKGVSCFLLISPAALVAMAPPEIPGLSGYISKPFSLSGAASSGSLKLAMDLINRNEYRHL